MCTVKAAPGFKFSFFVIAKMNHHFVITVKSTARGNNRRQSKTM